MGKAVNNGTTAKLLKRGETVALCCVVALTLAGPLTGCKDSDVLNELINDQDLGQLDESYEPLYKDTPTGNPDPTRQSNYESDTDNDAQQENVLATYSPSPTEPDQTTEQRENTPEGHDYQATQGTQDDTGKGTSPQISSNDDGNNGGGNDESNVVPGAAGGTVTRIDSSGNPEQLPENVGTVAAQGMEATIVQMLCGKGALVAANESWAPTMLAAGAFPNEGLESVVAGWDDDGTPNLSALAAAAPNCIIEESETRGLTDEEMSALAEKGVSCTVVTVYKLGETNTLDSSIVQNVQTIGELLKDANTQYDAQQQAKTYKQLHDQAIDNCLNANGGYSWRMVNGSDFKEIYQDRGTDTTRLSSNRVATAFIDSWYTDVPATTASHRSYNQASMSYLAGDSDVLSVNGVGMSMPGNVAGTYNLIDYLLQCGGVVNESYITGKRDSELPVPVVAGGYDDLGLSGVVEQRSIPSALWFCETSSLDNSANWTLVGSQAYPGVIVRNQSIADSVVASAQTANGYYNVGNAYGVYVLPSGLCGSWADGTPESFLAAPWAYCVFHPNGASIDLSTCTTYVDSYCKTFYRSPSASIVSDYADGIRSTVG